MHRKDVKSMKRKNAGNSLVPVGIGIVVIMVIILIVSIVMKQKGGGSGGGKTLDQLCIYFGDRIEPEDLY